MSEHGQPGTANSAPASTRKWRRGKKNRERLMVPEAEFSSYYGRPVLKEPTWEAADIAGYLFLGGLAGASSVLGAGAQASSRPELERASKITAFSAISLSLVALVHDLGRPERFINMLRVFKPTSPMSVGSWVLSGYAPLAGIAAASRVTGRVPRVGALATAGAALVGPAVAAYTAVLVADTAVPAWHDGFRELPFVFVGSGAAAAAGVGLLAAPVAQTGPVRRLAVIAAADELIATARMEKRVGIVAETYRQGRAGQLLRAARLLTTGGAIGAAVLGRRSRVAARLSGAALLAGSACTRFGIFEAGRASAKDPKYTVVPQRERLSAEQRRVVADGASNQVSDGAPNAVPDAAPNRVSNGVAGDASDGAPDTRR
jgi:formate-dependent nitrite reductase membrane component NrfD